METYNFLNELVSEVPPGPAFCPMMDFFSVCQMRFALGRGLDWMRPPAVPSSPRFL